MLFLPNVYSLKCSMYKLQTIFHQKPNFGSMESLHLSKIINSNTNRITVLVKANRTRYFFGSNYFKLS